MDAAIGDIAAFATTLTWDDVPESARASIRRSVIDSIGCAVGGATSTSARIAHRVLEHSGGPHPGRVIGQPVARHTPDSAAFANSVMIRTLDFNDYFPGGHPSDQLGPFFALAEAVDARGAELLTAITVAYETFIRLCIAAPLKQRGWDQGFAVAVGTAAGLSTLLELDHTAAAHAISLAAVSNVPLRVAKSGQASLWVDAGTSHAARAGLQCAVLARAGMTGPEDAFSGTDGVFELLTGGPFTLPPFGTTADDFASHRMTLKYWPVCGGIQSPVALSLELARDHTWDDIAHIDVDTYDAAWKLNGRDTAKWDPRTAQSAGLSLPYVVAWTIHERRFSADAFTADQYLRSDLRPLMQRIAVRVDPELDAGYPDLIPARFTVTLTDGTRRTYACDGPPGHETRPLTDTEVRDKFLRLVTPALGDPARAIHAADLWERCDSLDSLTAAFDAVALPDRATSTAEP